MCVVGVLHENKWKRKKGERIQNIGGGEERERKSERVSTEKALHILVIYQGMWYNVMN